MARLAAPPMVVMVANVQTADTDCWDVVAGNGIDGHLQALPSSHGGICAPRNILTLMIGCFLLPLCQWLRDFGVIVLFKPMLFVW